LLRKIIRENGGVMRIEDVTQTKDGTPVKILEKRRNKALGYWIDGFGNAHPAKWDNEGNIVEGQMICPAQEHDLRLDLHDWREKEKWVAFFRGDEGKAVCVHGPCLFDSYKEAWRNTDEMCPDPIKVIVKEKED
jgi:hypothetical protein